MIMVKILVLFLFFSSNAFCNSVVATNNNTTKTSTTQTTNNKTENTNQNINSNIENNLVGKKAANDEIFLTPISDDYYKDFKSFMLGDSVIGIIRKALDININKKTITEEIMGEDNQEKLTSDLGNIYLKTIIFLSDNFWSIWINDKKITNKTNNDENNEFVVLKINNNEAMILLRVSKTKWSYINSANKIKEYEYEINDDNQVEFIITLAPNQTFVASKNEVVDGKYRNEEELLMDSLNNSSNEFNLDNLFDANSFDFNGLLN